jgi:cobalt-zinc-cadmium efflux system outer membrane protein
VTAAGVFVGLSCWLAAAAGPAPAPPPVALSLDEALRRAEQTVPDLLTAESTVREAEATRVGAGVRLPVNPRIQVDARRGIDRGGSKELGWAAGADLLFEVANAAGARIEESRRRVAMARAELTVARLEARLLVFAAYASTKIATARASQAREALTIAERLKVVARERLEAGAGSEIETTSADVEVAESRKALLEAEMAKAQFEQELRFLLAIPAGTALSLTEAVAQPPAVPDAAVLVDAALKNRPDLQVLRDRVSLLEAADVRLGREAAPKLGVFGGLDASPDSPRFGLAGISVELPVAQRNQGPRAVARAERQTELTRLEVERRRTDHAVRATRARYEAHRLQLQQLATEGVPAAERRLSLVEGGWRAGRFDVLRVTTAARDLVRLRDHWSTTLADLWQERIDLERLVGTWPR